MLAHHIEDALASWTVRQCSFRIEYSPRVMEEIRLAVVDAFFSVPRGGAEIGGILLGQNEGHRVTITDYLPFDCEHATGPSFVLSPKDHIQLAEILGWARSSPGDVKPVGWYHSHTRSEIQLSPGDVEIHRRYFPEPHQVALVLRPHTLDPVTAGFFFWEADHSLHASASYQEFLLRPLATSTVPETAPAAVAEATAIPVEASRAAVPVAAWPIFKKWSPGKVAGWAAALVLVFVSGTLVNYRFWRPASNSASPPSVVAASPAAPPASMSLRARRLNGDLELTWSKDSALIAAATNGVISIQDGGANRQIRLDSAQVRGGSLLYAPTSEQITMQLTVATPTDNATESVMVILPKSGMPQTVALPAPRVSPLAVPHPAEEKQLLAKASKPFKGTSAVARNVPPVPVLTEAPPLRLNPDSAAVRAPDFVSHAPTAPPLAPAQRPGSPILPSRQSSLPQQPAPGAVSFRPAQPIRKVTAVFPPELHTFEDVRKVVEVIVTIDKNGKVMKAQGVPQRNVSQFLINASVNAALQWRFEPARRDNQPVVSDSVLQFVFGRK